VQDDPYIAKLRAMKPRFAGMNIKRLRVFGSRARGDATPESDIDLLVDLVHPIGLIKYAGLKRQFEEELGIGVDLVKTEGLHSALRNQILAEAQDV